MEQYNFDLFAKIYLFLKEKIERQTLINCISNWTENVVLYNGSDNISKKLENRCNAILENKKNGEDDIIFLLSILFTIDYNFSKYIDKYIMQPITHLNKNDQKIKVYPRIHNFNRRSGAYERLETHLKNIYCIIKKDNLSYNILNYYIDNCESSISVALIPAIAYDNIEQNNQKYINSLNHAIDNDCSIIISSEYGGDENLDRAIENIAYDSYETMFICSPTHNVDSVNRTKIFLKQFNKTEETYYKKHNPFTQRGINKENITNNNIEFVLFQVRNFGMIGLVICKDFFSEYTKDFIEQTQLDVLFIMSMTENYSNFRDLFPQYTSKKRLCILCNNCKAVKNSSEDLNSPILFGYYVKGNNNNYSDDVIKNKCDLKCDRYATCYFKINIVSEMNCLKINQKKHILG